MRRTRFAGAIGAIVVAAATGAARLDEGKAGQGWTLLGGAAVGAVVLAVRSRRRGRDETGPSS